MPSPAEFNQADLERIADPEVARVLHSILTVQKQTLSEIAEIKTNMGQMTSAVSADVERVLRAFPSEDTDGHRRFHETMIESLEERRRLRRAIQEKTIAGLLWAALVGLGLAVWDYVKHNMVRP